jgi:phosphate/sulfate permease
VLALVFDYTNGFHDAANAIASAISTRALTPRVALIIAAIANLGGALLSRGGGHDCQIDHRSPSGPEGLAVVLAALVGAIAWNFTTWYFGLPSSSSQALIGGLVGAGIASSSTIHSSTGVVGKMIIPMILSPTVGLLGGYLLMVIALWVFRKGNPHRVVPYCTDLLCDQPGARPWPAGCPKEHGHHRARSGDSGLSTGLSSTAMGRLGLRLRAGGRHILRRLADHANPRPENLPDAARLRR